MPDFLRFSRASLPLFSFLAVNTTTTPCDASCLQISSPIPLFAPVTTAYLVLVRKLYVSAIIALAKVVKQSLETTTAEEESVMKYSPISRKCTLPVTTFKTINIWGSLAPWS
uniref:Uncharacterized protein n=1 Tax=Opuntia streptacantha TaxID=393608 RepID=A0A7C8YSW1_OPUST